MSITDKLNTIDTALDDIKTAITNKGYPPSGDITTYAAAVDNLPPFSIVIPREVDANGVYGMPTTSFTFSLPNNATDLGSFALYYAFQNCTGLTSVDLSSLTTVSGSNALASAFQNCTGLNNKSISFPALTSTSFGNYTNQFNYMLQGVTGCTVHFPSNLQSVIGNWSSVTSGFGGTNTTVLFDLPATT